MAIKDEKIAELIEEVWMCYLNYEGTNERLTSNNKKHVYFFRRLKKCFFVGINHCLCLDSYEANPGYMETELTLIMKWFSIL